MSITKIKKLTDELCVLLKPNIYLPNVWFWGLKLKIWVHDLVLIQ